MVKAKVMIFRVMYKYSTQIYARRAIAGLP